MSDDAGTTSIPGSLTAQLSSAPFVPPSKAQLSALLPEFEFLNVIGIGGMSVVYRVRRVADGEVFAIKVMAPLYEGQEDEAQRFVTEAKTMLALHHPNIVAVHDYGQTSEGHLWLLMEYVDGVDMHRTIRAGGITPQNAYTLVLQLCQAVQYAHDHGVVHRDIKPANVLISRDGRVKFTDFGVAKPLEELAAGGDDGYGTPGYAAPERYAKGAAVDHRADVYSLGIVIHEMLSGETPRQAAMHGHAKLPAPFIGVFSKCLMADPARRYQSAREVGAALSRAIEEEKAAHDALAAQKPAAVIRRVPLSHPVPPPPKRRPWVTEIAAGIACVAIVLAIVFSEWRKSHARPDGTLPPLSEAIGSLLGGKK